MSAVEIFVVVFGAVMGYLIVDHLLGLRGKNAGDGAAGTNASESDAPPWQQGSTRAGGQNEADAPPRQPPWWDVLGVSLGASEDEIQRAYRVQIGKYHPDKVAHLGDELKIVAARRSAEINLAYQEAMRWLGKAV